MKILFIFLLLIPILSFLEVGAMLPLSGKVITIDPGHGGRDPGTRYGNILEKDLNLEISQVLKEQLEKEGAIVYLTRDADEDLSSKYDSRKKRGDLYRRILLIQDHKSDVYLSIHLNWYRDYYYGGAEVLYYPIHSKNKILAESLVGSFQKSNIKTRNIKQTDLYLYRNTRVPGVLLECGFLSNKNDRYLLQTKEYQQKFAHAVAEGLNVYFNS